MKSINIGIYYTLVIKITKQMEKEIGTTLHICQDLTDKYIVLNESQVSHYQKKILQINKMKEKARINSVALELETSL